MSAPASFARGHFLAVSVALDTIVPRAVQRALDLVGADMAALVTGGALIRVDRTGMSALVSTADATLGARNDPTAVAPPGSDELERWVATTLPPAARAVHEHGKSGPRLRVATDNRAISEVYEAHGSGWALVSTSPLLLASALEAPVDELAVARYAGLGHFLANESPWQGVRRIGPAEILDLRDGAVVTRTARPATSAVSSLAEATLAVVADIGDIGPVMELSGGLDSRLVLAAVAAGGVSLSQCLTIGSAGDADREVAITLASLVGASHEIVDLAVFASTPQNELVQLVLDAGADRGWVANPIDSAPLHWVEELRGDEAGLSGQNGEIARGFYYRGPHTIMPRHRRASALARWRLLSNAAVSPELFSGDVRAELDHAVVGAVGDWLDVSSRARFLVSTDEFYLRHRMTRWVGPAYAAAARRHPVVAPFFSVGFINAASALTIAARRHSSAVAAAVVELDVALSRQVLAGGRTPASFARGPMTAARIGIDAQARKTVRKLTQRLGGAPVRPGGTTAFARAMAANVDQLIALCDGDPLLSQDGLRRMRKSPDARDLSFLLSLVAWRNPTDLLAADTLAL